MLILEAKPITTSGERAVGGTLRLLLQMIADAPKNCEVWRVDPTGSVLSRFD
jgi:hypothetical protein